jgi:hypothetical protein
MYTLYTHARLSSYVVFIDSHSSTLVCTSTRTHVLMYACIVTKGCIENTLLTTNNLLLLLSFVYYGITVIATWSSNKCRDVKRWYPLTI